MRRPSTRRLALIFLAGGGAVGLLSCADIQDPAAAPTPDSTATAVVQQSPQLEALASVLTTALQARETRELLIAGLRDSPFPDHALPLNAWLSSARGGELKAALDARMANASDALATAAGSVGPVEVRLEATVARVRWTGDEDPIVGWFDGTHAEMIAAGSFPVLDLDGERSTQSVFMPPEAPLVVLLRPDPSVPSDAAQRIDLAGRLDRPTVSTMEEEITPGGIQDTALSVTTLEEECDPLTSVTPCDEPGTGQPAGGINLGSEYYWSACTNFSDPLLDADQDGLKDSCEYQLAYTFRPMLRVQNDDPNATNEPYWLARKAGSGSVKVFYMLAYHRDDGHPIFGSAHYGDSEFIISELHFFNGRWYLDQVFLSAHWNTLGDRSAYYLHHDLTYYGGASRVRPFVWVSRAKHANFPSWEACTNVAQDLCWGSTWQKPVEVLQSANVGHSSHAPGQLLLDCVGSRATHATYPAVECLTWDSHFGGWVDDTPQAGGYWHALDYFAF